MPEEQRNVTVEGWILAVGKEKDNDFHLIVSTDPADGARPNPNRDDLLNVEISALPPLGSASRDVLVEVRKRFRDHFVPTVPDAVAGYTPLEPVHVRITGSLFFDVDHPADLVGPGPPKPSTAWEIHPVADLAVLNR